MILAIGYSPLGIFKKFSERESMAKTYFGKLYFAMILMWLVITSVLPAFYFYQAFSYRQNFAWNKYLGLEIAKQNMNRNISLDSKLKLFQTDCDSLKKLGNYLESTGEFEIKKNSAGYNSLNPDPVHQLEYLSFLPFEGLVAKVKSVFTHSASDAKWIWYGHKRRSGIAYRI